MKSQRAREILDQLRGVRVAVYGDFCLDAYWTMDPRGSEVSVETGLKAESVGSQKYSLGGAANICANLAALQPAALHVIGVIGNDVFGREMLRLLEDIHADTTRMVVQSAGYDTLTYCKRLVGGEELPRIDFGIYNRRSAETDARLLTGLRELMGKVDVVILNQQVPGSITNTTFIDGINALVADFPRQLVVLDTRHYGKLFRGVVRKTNDFEAAMLNGVPATPADVFPLAEARGFAANLFQQASKPVFVSRGARGMLVADADGVHEVPGIQILGRVDPVGAGDTALSAMSCCLGAGVTPREAAQMANFAAAVTVQKLFQTGTASPEEIMGIAADPDYIYRPELAADMRQAQFVAGSDIEVCDAPAAGAMAPISHAVFDHDGTVSALRQGWEAVMEPVMMRAILGAQYDHADEKLYHKVHDRVVEYIDKSTGIQTIVQMESLVGMVREFGIVPAAEILDKGGYKKVYNDALMAMVSRRMARLRRGQLNVDDYAIKGAVAFLRVLRERGVTLYLASGTDQDDVKIEAEAMGYAALFNGGIYGAVGDIANCSKKMVIETILREHHLRGAQLATFGDGPVEIRECRKRDGLAIGVASDEIRRHGLNREKRTRLVKAGAHYIIPDFAQPAALLALLFP